MFVPLVDRLVQHLLQLRTGSEDLVCGEPLVARLPAGAYTADELQIQGPPTASGDLGQLVDEGASVVWSWPAPSAPGIYRIGRGEQTVMAASIGLADEESPLESLSADLLQGRLAAGRTVDFRAPDAAVKQRDVLWAWLLTGCVACLLAEVVALLSFRS